MTPPPLRDPARPRFPEFAPSMNPCPRQAQGPVPSRCAQPGSLIEAAASSTLAALICGRIPMPDTPDRATAPRSFESALAEFEALVEKMERGDLSLEDSVSAYERGVALHRYCEQALSTAERKIRILTAGPGDGGAEEALQPFDPGAGDARASGTGESAAPPLEPAPARPSSRDEETDGLPF